MRRDALRTRRIPALAAWAVLGLTAPGFGISAAPDEVAGTYRVHGTARLALGAGLDRDVELHADAVLERVRGGRDVRVHLAANGYACDLAAQLDGTGTLAFAPGQSCAIAITSPDARGRLDGRLRSGRGRLQGGHLALALSGEVEGTLSQRTGRVRILGQEVPPTWTPELPVHGAVEATAEGDVDRSRAAQR